MILLPIRHKECKDVSSVDWIAGCSCFLLYCEKMRWPITLFVMSPAHVLVYCLSICSTRLYHLPIWLPACVSGSSKAPLPPAHPPHVAADVG